MNDSPTPALMLGLVLLVSAVAGVLVVDSLITSAELRRAARHLREMPATPPAPAHTEN